VALIALDAGPQISHGFGRALDALHKYFLGVEQVAGDAHRCVLGTCFAEHVEEVQTTQGVGSFGAVKQAFEHGANGILKTTEIVQSRD
jgi:hypothetical protein